jgi:mannitol 2-dehydrogenase
MNGISSEIKLCDANLRKLKNIRVPSYNRADLRQHTVHIGVGGFHRAHQAVYLDNLLELSQTERWGECGIGLLKNDLRMRDALAGQDHLYTVVERSAGKPSARVIGSIVNYVYAPEEPERAIEKLASVDTRIVSLTITEGGYFLDEGTHEFTPEHPDIQHDLRHPGQPVSSLGYLAEALNRRRLRGLPPFTLMSCDNLQANGHVIKTVLLAFAGLRDVTLQQWIADHVKFPNSMVDRITPVTTADDIRFVAETFGLKDAWPVVTEPFMQWVIEDDFCDGRPQWERVGVQLVSDVTPYEIMKMRLLNAGHLAMAYLSALAGYGYVEEVMEDPLFRSFVQNFMEEVTPVVPRIPGTSVTDYKKILIERFSNPTIHDQVTRICSEGSAKLPKWVLPSIVELMETGNSVELPSLVVASWIHYLGQKTDERGAVLTKIDVRAEELSKIAAASGTNPRPMLALKSIFGERLPANAIFVAKVEAALRTLSRIGVIATLRLYQQQPAGLGRER